MIRSIALAALWLSLLPLSAQAQSFDASYEKIERGRYVAVLGDCVACHTVLGGKPFAGGVALETPFGKLVGPNITPDMETGIGSWTEADFQRMMHEGRGKDGVRLYPAMPYPAYTKVTPEDVSALWAYFRTIEPVKNQVNSNQLPFPFNIRLANLGWNIFNFKKGIYKPDAGKSAAWNRGAYLVEGLGHCGTCHTPKNILFGDQDSKALQGAVLQNWFAPNITVDKHAGLGRWSNDEIVRYLKTGANRFAIASGPMAEVVHYSTSNMTDSDLIAIAAYLKDSGPQTDTRATSISSSDSRMVTGQAIYDDRCAACHKRSGEGVPNLFPRLAEAPAINSTDPTSLVRVVLAGARAGSTDGAPTGPAMPAYAWNMTDDDIANVLTYIRNTWGNAAEPVSPRAVQHLREKLAR